VRVPLDRLLLKPNIPAGANILVVASLAHMYRSPTDDAPPVEVCDLGNGYWLVLDGRHRFLASVIAGRPDLLAELEAATPQT
jgi:hypothetical protein